MSTDLALFTLSIQGGRNCSHRQKHTSVQPPRKRLHASCYLPLRERAKWHRVVGWAGEMAASGSLYLYSKIIITKLKLSILKDYEWKLPTGRLPSEFLNPLVAYREFTVDRIFYWCPVCILFLPAVNESPAAASLWVLLYDHIHILGFPDEVNLLSLQRDRLLTRLWNRYFSLIAISWFESSYGKLKLGRFKESIIATVDFVLIVGLSILASVRMVGHREYQVEEVYSGA
ncbi:hypothetical protein B0H13DRAFT_1916353 [Mycena leptocephala]|nr:hypothetical protein B0H13DRAFT_1916353 [Mycena leptocephala]